MQMRDRNADVEGMKMTLGFLLVFPINIKCDFSLISYFFSIEVVMKGQ